MQSQSSVGRTNAETFPQGEMRIVQNFKVFRVSHFRGPHVPFKQIKMYAKRVGERVNMVKKAASSITNLALLFTI